MIRFFNEKIAVTLAEDTHDPVGFVHGDREYTIREITRVWQEGGLSVPASGRGRTKDWWSQRGRTFYRVTVDEGLIFDICYDPRKKQWYLSKSRGQAGSEE